MQIDNKALIQQMMDGAVENEAIVRFKLKNLVDKLYVLSGSGSGRKFTSNEIYKMMTRIYRQAREKIAENPDIAEYIVGVKDLSEVYYYDEDKVRQMIDEMLAEYVDQGVLKVGIYPAKDGTDEKGYISQIDIL